MDKNKEIIFDWPEEKTLKLDFDWIPPKDFLEDWEMIARGIIDRIGFKAVEFQKFKSSSNRGLHVFIKLNEEVSDMLRLKLQFLLGDDRGRCFYNWQDIQLGMEGWNKLFISNRRKRIRLE